MAAGDVTKKDVKVGTPGGTTNPRFVVASVEFGDVATGKTTVTAAEVGLRLIEGFAGCPWGMTSGLGSMLTTSTEYVSGGVSSVDLELVNDASSLLNETVSVIFWGVA